MTDRDWMAQASCTTVHPDTFFPTSTGNGTRKQAAQAILICRQCPVIHQCRDYANQGRPRYGVWAGTYRPNHPGGDAA